MNQLETDGVPAPSQFDPVHTRPRVTMIAVMDLNRYIQWRMDVGRPINHVPWREWLGTLTERCHSVRIWNHLWDGFVKDQDAERQQRLARSIPPEDERDQRETQEDVINGGTP